MTSFLKSDRSRAVAFWLFAVAALVTAMVVVGGATRLTGSGLSITQWKPVKGVIPPLNLAEWQAEFARYREIPQYKLLNRGMSLGEFQGIYWWEWSHRLLGRLIGVVFFLPFVWFAIRREINRRMAWRLAILFILGGLQGLVGWWMVASGLADRLYVAPERLMAHLGLAFALLGALVWTALDAGAGWARQTLPSPWGARALWLVALIYVQVLMGALVAGNHAGLIYNDWPLFAGRAWPSDYAGHGLWGTLAHSLAAVQANHRIGAYVVFFTTLTLAGLAWRTPYLAKETKVLGLVLAGAVVVQFLLGVATLVLAVPFALGMIHQLMAAIVFSLAVAFAWRVRRI